MKLLVILSMAALCLVSARNYKPRVAPDVYKPIVKEKAITNHEAVTDIRDVSVTPVNQKVVSTFRKGHRDFEREVRVTRGKGAMNYYTWFDGSNGNEQVIGPRALDNGQSAHRKAMFERIKTMQARFVRSKR